MIEVVFILDIDSIINKRFNTDKGILYFIELLAQKFPNLKMNLDILSYLNVVEMEKEYFDKTGFVAEFVFDDCKIKLLTNLEGIIQIPEEEILKSFLHELIHAVTSKADETLIYEGINFRIRDTKDSSSFLGLNEGITQYIANKTLGEQKDSYPYETKIASQLALIIGEENLIECYSNNSYEQLYECIKSNCIDFNDLDFRMFIESIYNLNGYLYARPGYNPLDLGECINEIQDVTMTWYNSSKKNDENLEDFEKSLITYEKAVEIQNTLLMPSEDYGLENLHSIEEIKGVENGKK